MPVVCMVTPAREVCIFVPMCMNIEYGFTFDVELV